MALESILVPYDGREEADAMLRFACEVVVGRRRVIALYVIRVPSTLPLDPLPASFDREGIRALDHAEAVAWHHGVSVETSLTRARNVADSIAGEAAEQGVDAIFMPLGKGRRPWQSLLLTPTVRAVMRKAPCPVLLGRQASLGYRTSWHLADPADRAEPHYPPLAESRP
jgi:nucleotide-binding universal stress UspA family protein